MTAKDAKNKNFIKKISNEVSFTNLISQDHWDYKNTSVLTAYNSAVKPPVTAPANIPENIKQFILNENDDMKKFFQNIIDGLKNLKTEDNAKPTDIVNAITEALTKPFEDLGTEIENSIGTTVTNQVKEAETRIQNVLKKEYDEKVTNLTTKVTDLETKNTALETELADQKGKKTTAENLPDGVKPVGSFNKGS
jgi:hypothetical protein